MSMHSMLPMLVQYLTGLCCIHANPQAVEIVLGDFVFDEASESDRDVDVTVTVESSGKENAAYMAYEVKREATPLDSSRVEALCMKLQDMPNLTHRAIVSTSGFTEPAIKKATKHGITLYQFKPWNQPLEQQFSGLEMKGIIQECFNVQRPLLCWPNASVFVNTGANSPDSTVQDLDTVFSKSYKKHKKYPTFKDYKNELFLRSTEQLLTTPKARQIFDTFRHEIDARAPLQYFGQAWPHTHTMDTIADDVYLKVKAEYYKVQSATIDGNLQWQLGEPPLYYCIENIVTKEPLAGAIISPDLREGSMKALVFSPKSRTIGIEFVQLEERHLNNIKKLSLGSSSDRHPQ